MRRREITNPGAMNTKYSSNSRQRYYCHGLECPSKSLMLQRAYRVNGLDTNKKG